MGVKLWEAVHFEFCFQCNVSVSCTKNKLFANNGKVNLAMLIYGGNGFVHIQLTGRVALAVHIETEQLGFYLA